MALVRRGARRSDRDSDWWTDRLGSGIWKEFGKAMKRLVVAVACVFAAGGAAGAYAATNTGTSTSPPGMNELCKLPRHFAIPQGATVAQVKAICAQHGTQP